MNYTDTINACELAADDLWQVVEDGEDTAKAESLFLEKLGKLRAALVTSASNSREEFDALADKLFLYTQWYSYISRA